MYTSNSPLLAASEVRRDKIDLPPRDALPAKDESCLVSGVCCHVMTSRLNLGVRWALAGFRGAVTRRAPDTDHLTPGRSRK